VSKRATALIGHIQSRCPEGHHRALPEPLCWPEAVEACGSDQGPGDEPRTIGSALELHLFKEGMRPVAREVPTLLPSACLPT